MSSHEGCNGPGNLCYKKAMKSLLALILASAALAGCSDNEMDASCRANLDCRAQRFIETADVFCKEQVEKLAKSGLTWDPSRDRALLSKYEWKDKSKGTITYTGDKAIVQAPTGATVRVRYECDIDPDHETAPVLGVRLMPEKLQP
jgi:hypothetical protein